MPKKNKMDPKSLELLEDFLKRYQDRGMGGYSGRELEILVFELLINVYPEVRNESMFDLSLRLKATETKVKNILYEVDLRRKRTTTDKDKDLVKYLDQNIKALQIEKGKVILELDNLFYRNRIKSILKEKQHLTDSSFNSDLIKMELKAFKDVLAVLYGPSVVRKFEAFESGLKLKDVNREILGAIKIPGTSASIKSFMDLSSALFTDVRNNLVKFREEKKVESNKKKKTKLQSKEAA